MEKTEDFGSDLDGSQNSDYCRYCYQQGQFTDPNITTGQMTEKVAGIMREMNMPEAQIEQVKTFIPRLKRWQS